MTATRPLHVGITPWRGIAGDAEPLCAQAERAEALGYASFWLPESHFAAAFGTDALPEPLMLLAAVAARTRVIRLATTSYLLPLRHPLQAAEQVAVLDRLCRGRVILGVGRGWEAPMLAAFGVAAGEKRRRFEATLAAMRRAWAGEPVSDDGRSLAPMPVQRPHPPLWVAAFGPRAVAQAGRLGLPYLASPVEPLEAIADNLARWREAAHGAGVVLPQERPVMRTVFVSAHRDRVSAVREALERQSATMARTPGPAVRRSAAQAPLPARVLVGDLHEVEAGLAELRERLGMTHLVVARPRIAGVPTDWLEDSTELLARAILAA